MFMPPTKSVKVTLAGVEYNVSPEDFYISGRNDDDLKYGAGKLMFFTRLAARARRDVAIIDAEYHHWKATELERVANAGDAKTKLPEWRTKNRVEVNPTYLDFKRKLAKAAEIADTVQGWVDAIKAKIDLLRTARADKRKELDVAGEVDPLSGGSHAERVRAAMKGRE